MKSIVTAAGVALACVVTLGAQSTTPTQTDQKSSMGSEKKMSKTVTLSGCVREGDAPDTYVLANVDMSRMQDAGTPAHGSSPSSSTGSTATGGSTSSSTASGTSGTSAGGSIDAANSVRLIGSANLKDHVGHQVEVTGTMAPAKDKSKAKGTSGTSSAAGETTSDTTSHSGSMAKSSDKNMHTLNVRSVKMVSASCSTN